MYIPQEIQCIIRNMVEGIYVAYMWSDLTVRNTKDHIDIRDHYGSCDIHTNKGEVKIEIDIPPSGYCKAATERGDIVLTIPHQTSATIYAKSYSGTATYNGLNIENLNQSYGLLTGILETGEGEIWLETKSGNIKIKGI